MSPVACRISHVASRIPHCTSACLRHRPWVPITAATTRLRPCTRRSLVLRRSLVPLLALAPRNPLAPSSLPCSVSLSDPTRARGRKARVPPPVRSFPFLSLSVATSRDCPPAAPPSLGRAEQERMQAGEHGRHVSLCVHAHVHVGLRPARGRRGRRGPVRGLAERSRRASKSRRRIRTQTKGRRRQRRLRRAQRTRQRTRQLTQTGTMRNHHAFEFGKVYNLAIQRAEKKRERDHRSTAGRNRAVVVCPRHACVPSRCGGTASRRPSPRQMIDRAEEQHRAPRRSFPLKGER